jgi:nucleoside recognition membrane protein YjiH
MNTASLPRSSSVNYAAFVTATTLSAATAYSVFVAATTAITAQAVAFAALSIVFSAVSLASITAWIDPSSTNLESYFNNMKDHAGYAIAGLSQFTAQVLVQALIQGAANGIGRRVESAIAGEKKNQSA